MSDSVGRPKAVEPTPVWLRRLVDEWKRVGTLAPALHVPEDLQPEWVTRLDREIARALYGDFKAEELANLTPKRFGSLLGRQCAMAAWIKKWLAEQSGMAGTGIANEKSRAFRSMVNMAVLRNLANRRVITSPANPAAALEIGGAPFLVMELKVLKEAVEKLEQGSPQSLTRKPGQGRVLTVAADAESLERALVRFVERGDIFEGLATKGKEQGQTEPETVSCTICWTDLDGTEGEIETQEGGQATAATTGPQEKKAERIMLAFPDLEAIDRIHRERLSEDVTAKRPQTIALPLVDAEDLEHVEQMADSVNERWFPSVRRLVKKALCSCVDREYEDAVGFAEGFASGFARNPGKLGMQKPKAPPLELYIIMASLWRYIQSLQSVTQLHEILTNALGPRRAGNLDRLKKICSRIGLSFGRPGRRAKARTN